MTKRITYKHILGLGLVIVFNIVVWHLLIRDVPKENRELIIHSLGMLEGYIGAQINYYFGDSAGSKRKTEILNEKINNPNGRNPDSDSSNMPD